MIGLIDGISIPLCSRAQVFLESTQNNRWNFLEDPRLSRMYLALMAQRLSRGIRRLWQQVVLRSGVVTLTVATLVVLSVAIGWRAHTRGRFARLKAEFRHNNAPQLPPIPRPGGQDALTLERSPIEGGTVPEFLSATILPGRGMNVLQITALLPKKGRVDLLASPSLEEAAKSMNDEDDRNGGTSLTMGGAIEAPWAGDLFGTASGNELNTVWHGVNLSLPGRPHDGVAVATGGLLLARESSSAKSNIMPDGGEAEALYDAGDFDGHWPSHMRIRTVIQLSSRAVEMRVTATNTGTDPQPVGLGWRPRFAVLGDRSKITLRLPSLMREELRSRGAGEPTGRLLPVDGTEYDFSSSSGKALGTLSLNDTYVHLRQAPLDTGPVVELRDPVNDYGLRMTMLSSSIKAVHVEAPTDKSFILLEPRFNDDDPFGREWSKTEDTGMVTLEPGQSTQFRIRLEIFAPNATLTEMP